MNESVDQSEVQPSLDSHSGGWPDARPPNPASGLGGTGGFRFAGPAWIFTFSAAAISVLLFAVCMQTYSGTPNLLVIFFFGLLLGMSSIVACWCCLANRLRRFPIALLALGVLGILLVCVERFDWPLFLMPAAIALPVVLTLEGTKFFLGRFQRVSDENAEDYQEGIQFGIRHLLICTTMVAVACGLWNLLHPWVEALKPRHEVWEIVLVISGTIAGHTLLSVWALMGHFRYWRLGVLLVVGSSLLYLAIQKAPGYAVYYWVAMLLTCWFTLVLLLSLLRVEGYRFVKRNSAVSPSV